jgi:hypothetical protein
MMSNLRFGIGLSGFSLSLAFGFRKCGADWVEGKRDVLIEMDSDNYEPGVYGVGFNHYFYPRVFELLLRLRANYL